LGVVWGGVVWRLRGGEDLSRFGSVFAFFRFYYHLICARNLPQSGFANAHPHSGSTCKQGEAEGVVISTGANTFFGRAASLVGQVSLASFSDIRFLEFFGVYSSPSMSKSKGEWKAATTFSNGARL
jgi:hypothetical protein